MSRVWKTKFGLRRVRNDAPTLVEAIVAATGLSDNPKEQAEIAAALMDLPLDQVTAEMAKVAVQIAQSKSVKTIGLAAANGTRRAVIVERKPLRRPAGNRRLVSRP